MQSTHLVSEDVGPPVVSYSYSARSNSFEQVGCTIGTMFSMGSKHNVMVITIYFSKATKAIRWIAVLFNRTYGIERIVSGVGHS